MTNGLYALQQEDVSHVVSQGSCRIRAGQLRSETITVYVPVVYCGPLADRA